MGFSFWMIWWKKEVVINVSLISTLSYENRVSKRFVIFLNFPCLIAWHMSTVLLAYVVFLLVLWLEIRVEVNVDRITILLPLPIFPLPKIGKLIHILDTNVVINWQPSKQGIRWPVSLDCIVGLGVDPSRWSIFLKLSADKVLVFKW